MKFAITRDAFAQAVSWVARTAPSRPVVPILSGIRIEAGESTLNLGAFDNETSARTTIDADVEETGVIVVPAKLLADIVSALPAGGIVNVELTDRRVVVKSGKARFALPAMNHEDYPTLPTVPTNGGLIDAETFTKAVAQVSVAASKDETLPLLTAVQIVTNDQDVKLLSTDRYRLAKAHGTWTPDQPGSTFTVLVRAKVLHEAAKAIQGAETIAVTISADGGIVGFSGNGRQVTTLVVGGDYPAVERLFPTETPTVATVNRAELLAAVKRVSLVAERSAAVKLAFDGTRVDLSVGDGSQDASGAETLEATVDGQPITVGFNPLFLQDGLNALDAPFVQFGFTTENKPVLMQQVTDDGTLADTYQYLLVPIRQLR